MPCGPCPRRSARYACGELVYPESMATPSWTGRSQPSLAGCPEPVVLAAAGVTKRIGFGAHDFPSYLGRSADRPARLSDGRRLTKLTSCGISSAATNAPPSWPPRVGVRPLPAMMSAIASASSLHFAGPFGGSTVAWELLRHAGAR